MSIEQKKQVLVKHFIYRVFFLYLSFLYKFKKRFVANFHKFVKSMEREKKREGKTWRSRESGRKRKSLALLAGPSVSISLFAVSRCSACNAESTLVSYIRERRIRVWVVGSRNSESAIWPARCAAAGCHGGVSAARWNWRVLGLVIYMSNYRKSCPNLACFHGLGDILCRSRNTACMRA